MSVDIPSELGSLMVCVHLMCRACESVMLSSGHCATSQQSVPICFRPRRLKSRDMAKYTVLLLVPVDLAPVDNEAYLAHAAYCVVPGPPIPSGPATFEA